MAMSRHSGNPAPGSDSNQGHPSAQRNSNSTSIIVFPGGTPSLSTLAVELFHRTCTFATKKTTHLTNEMNLRLTHFSFGRKDRPTYIEMSVVIDGECGCDQYSASVVVNERPDVDANVSPHRLHALGTLLIGNPGLGVGDPQGLTLGKQQPYILRIALDGVFAILRQHFDYVRFSKIEKNLLNVTIINVRSVAVRNTHVWLVWNNLGSMEGSEAQLYTKAQWKNAPYNKRHMKTIYVSDIDVLLENQGRILVFL